MLTVMLSYKTRVTNTIAEILANNNKTSGEFTLNASFPQILKASKGKML